MNLLTIINTFYLKLIIYIFLTLINCDINLNNIQTYDPETDQQFENERQNFDVLAKDYLQSLRRAHRLVDTDEEVVRSKRSTEYHRKTESFYDKGVFRLRGIIPLLPTCVRPLDFSTIAFNGQTYGICVSDSTSKIAAKVTVGPITRFGWERNVISWTVKDPKNVVSFVSENKDINESNLYVLIADSRRSDGTDVVVINRHNEIITKEKHTVNSRYPTAIAIWMSQTDNTYHLAIANSIGTDRTESFKSETYTYNWMQTYFDQYSEMTTYYVRDICAFSIHSDEFLAIANYKAGPNVLEVDSEIFKLDINSKKWRTFQRIRTFGAIDWEFFTFGATHSQEYFLAVANHFDIIHGKRVYDVNSVIYKFSNDKFVPFQCLATVGATQIKTFKGINGEFVLAVANMHQAVHLYQYNGWQFVETSVQYTSGVMSRGVVSLHFDYLPNDHSGVLFVSNPHHPSGHIFRMEFVYENPLGEWYNRSLEWCRTTDREVSRFGEHDVNTLFDGVFYVDQNQPIVINDDLVLDDIVVDSLTTPLVIDVSNGDELSHRLIEELFKLDQEINAAEAKLGQIIDILSNALRTNEDQVVTTSYAFKEVDFDCRPEFNCHFGEISAKMLNNDNINGLAEDVLPLNLDQHIDQSMHFQNLRVDNNILLNGLINGINTSHIVTRQGSHNIFAPKVFANDVQTNEVVVNRLINDKVINPSTVLLTNTNQVINNTIRFNDIHLNNLRVDGPINDINIEHFFKEVVTKDSINRISGEKRFNEIEMNELVMTTGSTINDLDLMQLWDDVLWTYGNQVIESPINFTDIGIDNNLVVDGLVNGISIPNDIILTNENAMILANKRFTEPIILSGIEILDSINGILLLRGPDPELDIMLRSKVQTVWGQKVFSHMHLGGHSIVRGTVDGVKLSQLERTLLLSNTSQHFDVLEIRGNAFFEAGVEAKTINKFNLEHLYNNALKLTDRHIPAFPHFWFNNANIESIHCLSINGLNIGRDLMTKNSPQVITGHKIFANGVKANDITVKYINGIDMNFINDTLLSETDQYISGEKHFSGHLLVNDLRVHTINNISMNDIVLLNEDQEITAPKVFTDVHVLGDLNVKSFESQVINGVHMRDLFENSLQYEKPQTVRGRLNFERIVVPKGTNLETNSVNGINLQQLMSDAVLIDIPQTISGAKTFQSPISMESLNFVHSFDNVTDYDLKHNWLLQDTDQAIHSDIVFDNNLEVNGNILMKNPIINNINLNVLNNNTVKVDEPTLIVGKTQMISTVVSGGHIELMGRIQGIDLDKEAVTLNGDHRLLGRIHFDNGFEVDKDLWVNGTVDGVRIEELCRYAVRKNRDQVISAPTIVYGDVVIRGPLKVMSGLNGANVDGFYRSVAEVDKPLYIKGVKRFRELIIEGPINATQLVAGFRIEKLFNNYMSLSRDQIVGSKLIFHNDLHLNKNVKIKGNIWTQNATINGIDLHRLNATVLKTFGNQLITGDLTFDNTVVFDKDLNVVNRRINGLDLSKDFMLKGRDNVITVPKIFAQSINVVDNVDIRDGKTIQGVDVSEMAKFAVMKTKGKYNIIGNKHFNSLEVDHLKTGLINGMEMSERGLLLTFGDQLINGTKILNNNIRVNSEINSNTINGINIVKLSQKLVLKGYNNSIISTKTFNSPLSVRNVHALGRVDGVDLHELNYFIGLPVNLHDLKVKLGNEDQKIASLQRALDGQWVDLAYYELLSIIHSGPALLSYYNTMTRSQHLFISGQYTDGCHEIEIHSNSGDGFILSEKITAIEANLMVDFTANGLHFVVISNTEKSKSDSDKCVRMSKSPNFGRGSAISQVFVFDVKHNEYKQMAVIHSQTVTDLKVIEDYNRDPCLLVAIPFDNGVFGQSMVICLNRNLNFYLKETFPFRGIDQFSLIRSHLFNRTLLASINSLESTNWLSDIAISYWSPQLAHFDHLVQLIPLLNPSTIHFVESPLHSSLFLFASEKKTSLTHNPLVRIFRYNHKQKVPLVEVQQIKDFEVIQIESLYLDDKQILVFMLSKDRLDLYRLKGSSGFIRVDRIDAQNALNFIVSNDYDFNRKSVGHLIAISYKECYAKIKTICKQETHVLKSIFK